MLKEIRMFKYKNHIKQLMLNIEKMLDEDKNPKMMIIKLQSLNEELQYYMQEEENE